MFLDCGHLAEVWTDSPWFGVFQFDCGFLS